MRKFLSLLLVALMLCALPLAGVLAEPVQEITFALQNEPDNIDPGVSSNSFAAPFLANCFEGLVAYSTEDGSLIPGNAEEWTISEDGTVYTFKLREGLKWSDGSPLNANDYVYSYRRILKPETTAQYVDLLTNYIVGAADLYDGAGSEDAFGVKALDDQTLEITLVEQTPFFIDMLAMWTFSPVQEATVEANGDAWTGKADTYVSNGPFMVSEMNLGESVVLVKNPEYYDADKVNLEKITFRYIFDMATALLAFENGEIDGSRSFPSSDYARLKADDAGVVVKDTYGTVYYSINGGKEPYDNPLVRKALNLAIDRQALIDDVVQIPATPAYSWVAPGYVLDGKDFVDGRSDFELSPNGDPAAAQAALAEAGYPNGEGFPTLQLSYYTNDTVKKVAEALAEMLMSNLNINVEISNEEWAIHKPNMQSGNYDIGASGWSGDYVHPMTFLLLAQTGNVNNYQAYSNPAYDELLANAQAEIDPAAAMAIMQEADDMASSDYHLLPLYYKSAMFLLKNNIEGVYQTPSDHILFKTAKVVD